MSDTQYNIECPACGTIMKKVFIDNTRFNIDICTDGCGGVFFDNRELEKISNSEHDIDKIMNDIDENKLKKVNQDEVRICPICNSPMTKYGTGVEGVEIDICNSCNAKFLDYGELKKIRNSDNISQDMVNELAEYLFQKELKDMLGKNTNKKPLTENVRKLFEKAVFKYILK